MNSSTERRPSHEVVATAAEWFARLQEDDATEQDFQEWQRWLNADATHQQSYREIEHAWRLIGEVRQIPAKKATRPERAKVWAAAASVLALIAAATTAYLLRDGSESYSTRVAEQRSVRLSDGSRVTLGASTQITPVFDAKARHVHMTSGEAFFEVARDPARPFTVEMGTTHIRAVGTAFNVHAGADRVWVSVTEGRVAVASGSAAAVLSAGQRADIARNGEVEEKPMSPGAVAWLQGRFEYRGEELRQVIEDLNRYTDRRIVLTDPALGTLRYSGTVFPDHLDEWLQGIGGALPVAVRDTGRLREISPAR